MLQCACVLFTHINRLNVNNATFKYFMSVILDSPISHQSANIIVTRCKLQLRNEYRENLLRNYVVESVIKIIKFILFQTLSYRDNAESIICEKLTTIAMKYSLLDLHELERIYV